MLAKAIECVQNTRNVIKKAFEEHNFYEQKENEEHNDLQIIHAVKFIIGSHATDYHNFMETQHHLRVMNHYLLRGKKINEVEQMLALEQQSIFISSKYVLIMYKNYLEKVVPANITLYHFIRQKQYYAHLITIRYVLLVGLTSKDHNIFMKIKGSYRLEFFRLLLDWLFTLIQYRCSAIFVNSSCVGPLINQTYLLLSALLGFDGHSFILNYMSEQELNGCFNRLLYINGFVLSKAIQNKNYLDVNTVTVVLRKILTSVSYQKVNIYLPSYLFAKQIGFIQTPYCNQVVYKLLLQFYITLIKKKQHQNEDDTMVGQQLSVQSLIIDLWSLIALFVEHYPELDKQKTREVVRMSINKTDSKSLLRAFLIRVAFNQHLDIVDEHISRYMNTHKQPYLVNQKIVPIETCCKNYHIVMNNFFITVLKEAAKGRILKYEQSLIWQSVINFNKFQIIPKQQYLQKVKSSLPRSGYKLQQQKVEHVQ